MKIDLHCGDCLHVMAEMPANSIDSIVTDPPYGLSFMGKGWDHGVPGANFWAEALRVAKPGAMLLAFGGTRTYHRLACAIEDAEWEIRDCLMWVYGQGFPKSHDISKAIDRDAGAEREVVGSIHKSVKGMESNGNGNWCDDGYQWKTDIPITAAATDAAREWAGYGTALKPSYEPIILAMKPLDGTFAQNALRWGVGGLNVGGTRIPANGDTSNDRAHKDGKTIGGTNALGGGWRDVGAGYRAAAGRWPANLILGCACDGDTHEAGCAVAMLDAQATSVPRPVKPEKIGKSGDGQNKGIFGMGSVVQSGYYDGNSRVSRFFYVAKASRRERNAGLEGMPEQAAGALKSGDGGWRNEEARGRQPRHDQQHVAQNFHPTVKPIALLRYLCRLTKTPSGGVVLDPFVGSGSTGCAAVLEGRSFIGIDTEADYLEIARRRIAEAQAQLALPLEMA